MAHRVLLVLSLSACASSAPGDVRATSVASPPPIAPAPAPSVAPVTGPDVATATCPSVQRITPGAAFDTKALAKAGAVQGSATGAPSVFEGTVFGAGSVGVGSATRLVVPDTAIVTDGAPAARIEVFVARSLHFKGHPPNEMPLTGVRQNMGVAYRIDEDDHELTISTFGEFATKEGGAAVLLYVRVPARLTVDRRTGLTGALSAAAQWHDFKAEPHAGQVGHWYSTPNANPLFKRVKLEDDPVRVVAHAGAAPEALVCAD